MSSMEVDSENQDLNSAMKEGAAAVKTPAASPGVGLPWIEKYRPKTLDDLVAHEDIVSTIQKLIKANRLPHLLFYGPPGKLVWVNGIGLGLDKSLHCCVVVKEMM